MADHSKMRLGRKAIKTDTPNLGLGRLSNAGIGASARRGGLDEGHTSLGHDAERQLSCCTIAGAAHAVQVWSANTGSMITIPDADH